MQEIWEDIKGYEGLYQVSNLGRVRNGKGKIHKSFLAYTGYEHVVLYDHKNHSGKNGKHHLVHRLVAEAFVPNPDGLPVVNHIDENRANNVASNLEWCTQSYNLRAGTVPSKRSAIMRNHKSTSKPVEQYTDSGVLVARYPSLNEAGRQTGWYPQNIRKNIIGDPRHPHAYGYIWKYAEE